MGTRQNPGKYDCLSKAKPDEPIFVILGRDRHGAAVVREWARLRELAIAMDIAPQSDAAMVREARQLADKMEAWREKNWVKRRGKSAA